jgi:ABC-type transporter Mla maintaining outer membrane lipid asymmetry ATPase subunit MlaF
MEEPNLSAAVLRLANLVQLTIADLSRMMSQSNRMQRLKTRLARALAYHPSVVALCNPTDEMEPETIPLFIDLIKRTRKKLKYTLIIFTSDAFFLEEIANRIIFLDPAEGVFIENRLRGWYHRFFPFLKPSTSQVMQLSMDVAEHNRIIRAARHNIGKH